MYKKRTKMSASQEIRLEAAEKVFPKFFEDICVKFVIEERHEEFRSYVLNNIACCPHIFNPNFIRENMNHKRKEKNVIDKNEAKLNLKTKMEENLLDREYFIGNKEFHPLENCANELKINLQHLISLQEMDKISSQNKVRIKIYQGMFLDYIKTNQVMEDKYFYEVLQNNKIKMSKNEICFSIRLYNIAKEFTRIQLLTLPLSFIRINLNLIKQILEENKEQWQL